MCRPGITVLESVPSLIQGMLAESISLDGLRWMLPTGEAMPPELAHQWLQRYPQIGLVNAYGPAECSDDVAFFRVDLASTRGTYLPIGTPTDNNRLYLLDGALELVPLGAVGELCVAGTGVGGYVGDPLRTARCLCRTRSARRASACTAPATWRGVAATVCWSTSAYRPPGEDSRLPHRAGRDRSAPARTTGAAMPPSACRRASTASTWSATWWPPMKPEPRRTPGPHQATPARRTAGVHGAAALAMADSLPLNANGKLDRKACRPGDRPVAQPGLPGAAQRLEATLAAIWAEVLKVERVGVQDNFFELGGHSLLATQIASRVQKTLQRDVPLRAMFECSTVAALAEYIDGLAANEISAQKVDRLSDLMAELEGL
jgi:acyl-CoA synthetase (AMP-forming)/AMP-acid ligase II/acyl carrier protein